MAELISWFEASRVRSSLFRSAAWPGAGSSERGGGGRGARFASPMRKRVIVSWAFVGTPLRIVLGIWLAMSSECKLGMDRRTGMHTF